MNSDFLTPSDFLNPADLEKLVIAREKENSLAFEPLASELSTIEGSSTSRHTTKRRRWAQTLIEFFTGRQTLSIRKKQLKNKTIQWIVYDPHLDSRHVFESEAAVRDWLEQRYHQ